MPNPLRIAAGTGQNTPQIRDSYAPLLRYLSETLGVKTTLIIPSSYDELIARFHRGEIDLAFFSGVYFVQAEQQDGAIPLVMRMIDRHATSTIITRSGVEGNFPEDFRGRSFAYGPRTSTSGSRMPQYFFKQMRLQPEKIFGSVTNFKSHDAVIAAVVEGRVDLGVVDGPLLRKRVDWNAVDPGQIRVVWESPPYTDYVWAVPSRLSPELRNRIRDAFLQFDFANPDQEKILKFLGDRAYVPATREDYNLIRTIVTGSPNYSPP